MPDNPIDKPGDGPSPEDKLRKLFDDIEREESSSESRLPLDEIPIDPAPRSSHMPDDNDDDDKPIDLSLFLSEDEIRLLKLEEEIEKTRADHREQAAGIKSEFDEKMQELEGRLNKIRAKRESTKATQQKKAYSDAADSRGLGYGLSIAYTFIGLPLLGALIGYGIDRAAGTTIWMGICTIVGMVLGLTYTVLIMNRANKKP